MAREDPQESRQAANTEYQQRHTGGLDRGNFRASRRLPDIFEGIVDHLSNGDSGGRIFQPFL
jgi:hypothetical protein